MRIKFLAVLTLVTLVSVVYLSSAAQAQFPLPSPRPQATPAPADPRLDQLRVGLEKQGLKVLDVYLQTQEKDLQFLAYTAARYAQPNWKDVSAQAFVVWGVMYDIAAKEPPRTLLSGVQNWGKYGIALHVRVEPLTALVNDLRSATTDAEKQAAVEKFSKTVDVRIFDYVRGQFVDLKDFVNKNFTS